MLILKRKVGESIKVGNEVFIKVLGLQDDYVSIGFKAPQSVSINRYEKSLGTQPEKAPTLASPMKYYRSFIIPSPKMPLSTRLKKGVQKHFGKFVILLSLALIAYGSYAGDALSSAEEVVKDTYNGSIKTYLYVGEAVAAIITLIFTRNIKTLGGVGALAIFLNVVASLAGI